MTRLEIRLFGQIAIQRDGEPLPGLSSKATELLCYLLLQRERGHTRESLAGLFWPDAPDPLAKKYLRQAIWRLQSKLASRELLMMRAGWIRINPEAGLWLDFAEFEHVYDFHRDVPGPELTDRQAQAMEAAAILYRGDLLESWYQDWCVYERDRLQLIYLAMLEQLMAHCEARGYYAKGVDYGQRILRHDPARECTHRLLMRLHYQAGDRTAALRQYERCATAMAQQFNVRPSQETAALFRQVRGDQPETPAREAAVNIRPATEHGGDLLMRLQASLDHLQAALTGLQRQVQQQVAPASRRQSAPAARPALHENGRYPGIVGRQEAR
jgi:DNA-binding SARP family transcriptional activator